MSIHRQDFVANPFAMLLDPERVAHDVACSERLQRLRGRIYRPLDKPLIAKRDGQRNAMDAELADFDLQIEACEIAADELPDDPQSL